MRDLLGLGTFGSPYLTRKVVTGGIIAAVLALDLLVASGRMPIGRGLAGPEVLIGGLLAGAAIAVTLARIEYGILLLPVVATVVPFAVGTGTASPVVASTLFAAFLAVAWIARMLLTRDLALTRSPVNLPLLGFVLVAALATVGGNVVRDPLVYVWSTFYRVQIGGLAILVLSAGVLFVAMNGIRELRWIRRLVWLFLGIGAVAIVGYLLPGVGDLPGFETGGLFSMWVVALALGQALFNDRMPAWSRVALVALAAAWLLRRFFLEAGWLSGWVPALVAVSTISALRSRYLIPLVAVGVALGWVTRFEDIYATQVVGQESGGNFLRLDIWRQNLEVTKDHLLLGTGVAGYAPYYMTYFADQALSSHSNYLDVLSQTGVVGSFFFLWLLVAMFRAALDARRRWLTGFGAGFANGVMGGLAGLVVVMALGDWFIPFVYNQTIVGFRHTIHSWLFVGALASMQRLEAEE